MLGWAEMLTPVHCVEFEMRKPLTRKQQLRQNELYRIRYAISPPKRKPRVPLTAEQKILKNEKWKAWRANNPPKILTAEQRLRKNKGWKAWRARNPNYDKDRKRWRYQNDPEYRKRILANQKRIHAKNKNEKNAKARWRYQNDPEYRARLIAIQRNSYQKRRAKVLAKNRWRYQNDPEYRQKIARWKSNDVRKIWKSKNRAKINRQQRQRNANASACVRKRRLQKLREWKARSKEHINEYKRKQYSLPYQINSILRGIAQLEVEIQNGAKSQETTNGST